MPKITELGSFNPPENLDEDIESEEDALIEIGCDNCIEIYDKDNETCYYCMNNLANER